MVGRNHRTRIPSHEYRPKEEIPIDGRAPEQQRGPEPERVHEAIEDLLDTDMPGTPKVSTLRTLQKMGVGSNFSIGHIRVHDWRIQQGDPQHGAKRSDDHVSKFEVEYPGRCPECDHYRLRWDYRTNHNISGSESEYCPRCDHVLNSEEWG